MNRHPRPRYFHDLANLPRRSRQQALGLTKSPYGSRQQAFGLSNRRLADLGTLPITTIESPRKQALDLSTRRFANLRTVPIATTDLSRVSVMIK